MFVVNCCVLGRCLPFVVLCLVFVVGRCSFFVVPYSIVVVCWLVVCCLLFVDR